MKKIIFLALVIIGIANAGAQINLDKIKNTVSGSNSGNNLSNDEVIKGLREALTVGTNNATSLVSKTDGFYKNPSIKIPFPQDAIRVKEVCESIGMKPQVDKFVLTLNRAAEEASKEAAPIFINTIKSMSVSDGFSILKGADNAATKYLQDKTYSELKQKFKPIVKNALTKVEITKYWSPLITTYNKTPGVQKMNPDLEEYVTIKALDGLFKMIAQEELKIRKDPAARITDLLKKVFG
jgi:broad specificity polyphosphatase/5'/3'-nucleotidase SurE